MEPTRNWTITINNTETISTTTQAFQTIMFRVKELLKSAGWTITRSSTGGTAGAGDNIATAGDIQMGTSGNGAWFVASSPAGWADADKTVWFLFAVNDSTDPFQGVLQQFATEEYTGGSTASLPTTVGLTVNTSSTTLHSFTSSVITQIVNWYEAYNDEGDIILMAKTLGKYWVPFLFYMHHFDENNAPYVNDYNFIHFSNESTSNLLTSVSDLRQTFFTSIATNRQAKESPLASCLSWASSFTPSNGSDDRGNVWIEPIQFVNSGNFRYFGSLADIYAGPQNGPHGAIAGEDVGQTYVRVFLGQYFWFYMPFASLPYR